MIISHARKFIFLKTRKTAGTSIEIALSALCGPDDVITPISPRDEALRTEMTSRSAQHYFVPFDRYTARDWARLLCKGMRQRFYNHNPASHVMNYVPPEAWDGYFKFCFERNPWDKVVSSFFWERERAPALEFSEFVLSGRANKVADFDLYSIKGEIVVDRVFRYENLYDSLLELYGILGVSDLPVLPKAKAGIRKTQAGYQDICGFEERQKIARVFAREIAHFGYEF